MGPDSCIVHLPLLRSVTLEKRLRFEHPVAQRFADLAGVKRDLELTIEACAFLLGRPALGSAEAIFLSRAVGAYAIVTYCRTITTGVRSGISEAQILALPPQLRRAHGEFKDLRDKFIAHSANSFEDNSVTVEIAQSAVSRLGTLHSRSAGFSHEQIIALRGLAIALLEMVGDEYELERLRVWQHFEGLAPGDLSSVLKPPRRFVAKDPKKQRKKFGSP